MPGIDDGYRWRKYGQKIIKARPSRGRTIAAPRPTAPRASTSRATPTMPITSPTRASTTTINPCPAGEVRPSPPLFPIVAGASVVVVDRRAAAPFSRDRRDARGTRDARRDPRLDPQSPTRVSRRCSSAPRVPRALHVGRAPGPGGPSPRYPRAPFHRSPGRHPPRPAARQWSTKRHPPRPSPPARRTPPPRDTRIAPSSVATSHLRASPAPLTRLARR